MVRVPEMTNQLVPLWHKSHKNSEKLVYAIVIAASVITIVWFGNLYFNEYVIVSKGLFN